MAQQANKHCHNCDLFVGHHAWLSTEHLSLVFGLSRKLASCFSDPYKVIKQINPVSFKLELPAWHMHPVFHCSQLKKAQGQVCGTVFYVNDKQSFHPSAAASGEFEAEDFVDHHVCGQGRSSEQEYLGKWCGYPLQEATWEPRAHLPHSSAILASYLERRGLSSFPGGVDISFWFSFVDCVLVYRYAYVFVRLCLDVHVVHIVLLCIGHDSCYAISSTYRVAPQHTLGPLVL